MLQPRCVVSVFLSSFKQKGECLFVLGDLDPLNCRRSHVGETPDRGIAATGATQTDRSNATASVRNTSKQGPACKLDYVPERGHLRSGWIATHILTDSREQGWATQSAPPVLLYYFILCLPVVHPG